MQLFGCVDVDLSQSFRQLGMIVSDSDVLVLQPCNELLLHDSDEIGRPFGGKSWP